jgi:hypothetical protein
MKAHVVSFVPMWELKGLTFLPLFFAGGRGGPNPE